MVAPGAFSGSRHGKVPFWHKLDPLLGGTFAAGSRDSLGRFRWRSTGPVNFGQRPAGPSHMLASSDALCARCAEVRDAGVSVDGHEQIEFGEQRAQLTHDAIGTADREGVYIWASHSNCGGS
jgi:hypothetical protein